MCKQYYEDGYKRGKRRGQRERNDIIMGEQRVRAIGSAIADLDRLDWQKETQHPRNQDWIW